MITTAAVLKARHSKTHIPESQPPDQRSPASAGSCLAFPLTSRGPRDTAGLLDHFKPGRGYPKR